MRLKLLILLLLVLKIVINSEEIQFDDIDNHSWEASSIDFFGEISNSTITFHFDKRSNKVEISKQSIDEILWTDLFQYEYYKDEYPYELRIFQTTPDQPAFIIFDRNNKFDIVDFVSMSSSFESFESIKKEYVETYIEGVVNGDLLRIRTAPSLSADQIGSLHVNEKIQILNESDKPMQINNMNSTWYKIKKSDGIIGWSYGHFIDKLIPTSNVKIEDLAGITGYFETFFLNDGFFQKLFVFLNKDENIFEFIIGEKKDNEFFIIDKVNIATHQFNSENGTIFFNRTIRPLNVSNKSNNANYLEIEYKVQWDPNNFSDSKLDFIIRFLSKEEKILDQRISNKAITPIFSSSEPRFVSNTAYEILVPSEISSHDNLPRIRSYYELLFEDIDGLTEIVISKKSDDWNMNFNYSSFEENILRLEYHKDGYDHYYNYYSIGSRMLGVISYHGQIDYGVSLSTIEF